MAHFHLRTLARLIQYFGKGKHKGKVVVQINKT